MASRNTHRAPGRAVIRHRSLGTARALSGSLALGTVLVGSALGMQSATAAPAPTDTTPSAVAASPQAAAPAPNQLNSTEKLRWGSRGDAVSQLQSALNDRGAGLAVDGVFGPRTHSAVKNFQRSAGIGVDGVVGPITRSALNTGVSGSAGGTAAPVSSSQGSTSSIVDRARSAVDTPYSWGGSSLGGMDCSGLVSYAYQGSGLSLGGRTSGQIANGGRWISQSEAQPGDIVVWPGHVAIYVGNGQIIDASGSQQRVVERSIWGSPSGFVTYR